MTTEKIKLDKNIIRTTYNWVCKFEDEESLFDYLICLSTAFRFAEKKEAAVKLASMLSGIEKFISENYSDEERKNIITNAIMFGEKAVAAFQAARITEIVTVGIHEGIEKSRKSKEQLDELSEEEKAALIKGDFGQN